MDANARTTSTGRRQRRSSTRPAGSVLGDWIRSYRTAQSVSQRELADRAGLSRSYLCDIERGRGTKPSVDTLDRISVALGADRTELLRLAGILEPPRDPEEHARERKLVAVFRGLSENNQHTLEAFARFLLSEEQHWVQPRLVRDRHGPDDRSEPETRPSLFDGLDMEG